MWVVVGSVFYLSKEVKDVGCFGFRTLPFKGGDGLLLLGKVRNPKQCTYGELGVVGSVLYLSEEAKGCFSLVKYGTQNNPHTAMWVVLGSILFWVPYGIF